MTSNSTPSVGIRKSLRRVFAITGRRSGKHLVFDNAADDMRDSDVPLLYALSIVGRYDDGNIDEFLCAAAVLAEETDDGQAALFRLGNRAVHIFRFAACADGYQRIPFHTEGFDLP